MKFKCTRCKTEYDLSFDQTELTGEGTRTSLSDASAKVLDDHHLHTQAIWGGNGHRVARSIGEAHRYVAEVEISINQGLDVTPTACVKLEDI